MFTLYNVGQKVFVMTYASSLYNKNVFTFCQVQEIINMDNDIRYRIAHLDSHGNPTETFSNVSQADIYPTLEHGLNTIKDRICAHYCGCHEEFDKINEKYLV